MNTPKVEKEPKQPAKPAEKKINLAKAFGIDCPTAIDTDEHVIVVEDQQDMRLIVTHHLQKLQFKNVVQASNGLEAFDKMKEIKEKGEKISVVICSMEMPVMGGLDLLAEIRESVDVDRQAFCLALDNVTKERIMLGVEHGVDEIIAKPFTLGDIIPKLRSAFKLFHNPSNPEPVYELAKQKLRDQCYDEAEVIYKKLAKATPKAVRPIVGLARIEYLRDNVQQALQYLAMAEKKNPSFVHTYSLKGDIYANQSKIDEALAAYLKAIDISPLNPMRYIKPADMLLREKRFEETVSMLQKALEKELYFPLLYHFLSQAYFNMKDYKKATRYIRNALNSDPDNIDYLNQYAIALKATGLVDDAMKQYNAIIKLEPGNIRALFNKAILLQDTNQFPEAIKTLERLLKKHPNFEKAKKKIADIKDRISKAKTSNDNSSAA